MSIEQAKEMNKLLDDVMASEGDDLDEAAKALSNFIEEYEREKEKDDDE